MAGGRIGDIFWRLLADGSGLTESVQKEAQKAGDAGAKTLGQRLSSGLKTDGVKAFGRVASATFAVAAVGAIKLEEAAARVRAETGATADEANAAAKAINRAAGSEQLSLEAVSEIAIRVRRDIGATGTVADDLTARFAKFARVTKQDGTAAVEDFDNILDRWNLDASKSADIQDVLIAGWQKFGGTIEGNQKALAALAPQLQALNLGWEDGAALINLFNASGLDAEGQVRALNTAIKKLKPGQTFDDLVREITRIEDPTKRAQKAIEIFGARGGVELANALHPGITGLQDFTINSQDAGDKVNEMGDILDGTPLERFRKFLSEAAAGVREFGFDLGSAVTALSSLGFLISSIGGGKLLKGLGSKLAGGVADAWKAVRSSALVSGAIAKVSSMASTAYLRALIFGDKVSDAVSTAWGKVASSALVKSATTKAGALISGVFSAAVGAAEKLADAVAGAFSRLPGSSVVKSAVSKAGALLGTGLGIATAVVAGIVIADQLRDELGKRAHEAGVEIGKQIATGTTEGLTKSRGEIERLIGAMTGPGVAFNPIAGFISKDALAELKSQLAGVEAEITRRGGDIGARTGDAIVREISRTATAQAAVIGEHVSDEFMSGQQKRAANVARAAREFLARPIGEQLVLLGPAALRAGAAVALGVASGLRQNRADITSALQQLREDMKNRISPKREVALRIGQLFSRALARGLKDVDPVIKAQAEGTRGLIEAELLETVKKGGEAGKKIQDELEQKLHSKDPAVKAQAQRTKSLIDAALKAQPPKTPGEAIGEQLNNDLGDKGTALGKTAYNLGRTIAQNLMAGVRGTGQVPPTGPSGGGNVATGGQGRRPELASGTSFVPRDMLAVVHRGEIVVPEVQSAAIRSGRAVLSTTSSAGVGDTSGGDTFNLYLPDARHTDPWAVLDKLPRYAKQAKAEVAGSWRVAG